MTTAQFAKRLAEAGFAVFPVKGKESTYSENGLKDATLDGYHALDWFERTRATQIGVHAGRSGLVILDVDYKEAEDGTVLVDGYNSLDENYLFPDESFSYTSVGGHGKHILYAAPEGATFNGTGRYRGMAGVDRRAGESYIVYNSTEIPDRSKLTPAPEWLCDESTLRTLDRFEGSVSEWYETLEQGEPSVIVRAAMERARKEFEDAGNDYDHAAVIERQFEAIRLGSEGHSGVPELLAVIEELFFSRTGSHSRTEDEWMHEWLEGLSSGVEKYGAATELRASLPAYDLTTVPASVPSKLLTGESGTKDDFTALLRALLAASEDDLFVTSVLWNCPRTRDLAREWGLEFCFQRVTEAREKPEPVRENPTLPDRSKIADKVTLKATSEGNEESNPHVISTTFLSTTEAQYVKSTRTFIDAYCDASALKGFWQPAFDVPSAWTALSMAVGPKAVLGYNALGVNLWFISLAGTGQGKTSAQKFLKSVLNLLLKDGESYYNVGASSSPAAIHEELLLRDGKASMLHHDEAATFFSDINNTEWMRSLEHMFSAWYDGEVEPVNKIRLPKELRGKSAVTSFNLNMSATPDKLLGLVTTEMFESGFLSRVNWSWAPPREKTDEMFDVDETDVDVVAKAHPIVYELAADLAHMSGSLPDRLVVKGSAAGRKRIAKAAKDFDVASQSGERYDVLQGPLTRLKETLVKCASLLALYRGEKEYTEDDALISISYCAAWYEQMVRVVNETSESEFSRDTNEIEAFIRAQGGTVSEARLNYRFRSMIRKSPRELTDRIDFLRVSGRINREEREGRISFSLNG